MKNTKIIEFLFSKGFRVDIQNQYYHIQSLFINAREHNDRHFVGPCCSFKRKDSLSFDELCLDSHLHLACFKGHLLIVQYHIENGRTPLHFASIRGRTDVINYLVSKGGNKNVKDKNGKRP